MPDARDQYGCVIIGTLAVAVDWTSVPVFGTARKSVDGWASSNADPPLCTECNSPASFRQSVVYYIYCAVPNVDVIKRVSVTEILENSQPFH